MLDDSSVTWIDCRGIGMSCGRMVACELTESWSASSEGGPVGVRVFLKTSCAVGRPEVSALLAESFPLARDKDPNHDERVDDWYCSRSVLGNGTVPSTATSKFDELVSDGAAAPVFDGVAVSGSAVVGRS